MAKLPVKNTIIQLNTTGTTYAAIAQVTGFGVSGTETETYESRTLDGSVGIPHDPTGYAEGGSVTLDLLWDPALAGHQDLTDLITAGHLTTNGLPNDKTWKMIFPNTASTEITFVSAGIGFELTGEAADGLRASVTLKLDGIPTFPT
jgi:hypothetical protein